MKKNKQRKDPCLANQRLDNSSAFATDPARKMHINRFIMMLCLLCSVSGAVDWLQLPQQSFPPLSSGASCRAFSVCFWCCVPIIQLLCLHAYLQDKVLHKSCLALCKMWCQPSHSCLCSTSSCTRSCAMSAYSTVYRSLPLPVQCLHPSMR